MVDLPKSNSEDLYEPTIARLHEAAQPYAACVVPILGRGRRTQYASKGSGVLLGSDRPQFLISAAHVLEESRKGGVLRMALGSRIRDARRSVRRDGGAWTRCSRRRSLCV